MLNSPRPNVKPEHRLATDRSGLHYSRGLTGAKPAIVERMLLQHGDKKRTTDTREGLNGICCVLLDSCHRQTPERLAAEEHV